jgi:hypothetical protein
MSEKLSYDHDKINELAKYAIEETLEKYKQIDALTQFEHGLTVAIAIFGKSMVEQYLQERQDEGTTT